MPEILDFIWNNGEKDRKLGVYRPCSCGTCSKNPKGVGYLSFSDAAGRGLTVWITEEKVFRRLASAIKNYQRPQAGVKRDT